MKYTRLFILIIAIVCMIHSGYADTTLSVSVVAQEHSQWCWAGSSLATIKYFGGSPSQCQLVNWAWGRSDCCNNGTFSWDHSCNQPNYLWGTSGSVANILANWSVKTKVVGSYLEKRH